MPDCWNQVQLPLVMNAKVITSQTYIHQNYSVCVFSIFGLQRHVHMKLIHEHTNDNVATYMIAFIENANSNFKKRICIQMESSAFTIDQEPPKYMYTRAYKKR